MPYSLLVVFANAKFVKFDIILGESGPQKNQNIGVEGWWTVPLVF